MFYKAQLDALLTLIVSSISVDKILRYGFEKKEKLKEERNGFRGILESLQESLIVQTKAKDQTVTQFYNNKAQIQFKEIMKIIDSPTKIEESTLDLD